MICAIFAHLLFFETTISSIFNKYISQYFSHFSYRHVFNVSLNMTSTCMVTRSQINDVSTITPKILHDYLFNTQVNLSIYRDDVKLREHKIILSLNTLLNLLA